MRRKCSICDNVTQACYSYRDSYICEDCLNYICGLDIIKHEDIDNL